MREERGERREERGEVSRVASLTFASAVFEPEI